MWHQRNFSISSHSTHKCTSHSKVSTYLFSFFSFYKCQAITETTHRFLHVDSFRYITKHRPVWPYLQISSCHFPYFSEWHPTDKAHGASHLTPSFHLIHLTNNPFLPILSSNHSYMNHKNKILDIWNWKRGGAYFGFEFHWLLALRLKLWQERLRGSSCLP